MRIHQLPYPQDDWRVCGMSQAFVNSKELDILCFIAGHFSAIPAMSAPAKSLISRMSDFVTKRHTRLQAGTLKRLAIQDHRGKPSPFGPWASAHAWDEWLDEGLINGPGQEDHATYNWPHIHPDRLLTKITCLLSLNPRWAWLALHVEFKGSKHIL